MTAFFYITASVLLVLGIFMIMGLNSVRITQDIMDLMRPASKLRTMAEDIQTKKKRGGLYFELHRIRNTMEVTGRGKMFPLAITGIIGGGALGVILAWMMDNLWLMPALVIFIGSLPFLYMNSSVEYYEKVTRDELETALSIITNAYIRTEDIITAVDENIRFIKPPLRKVFAQFLQDAKVTASTKEIIYRLRDRLDDKVFFEWCTTLIQCQDDRTLKENLNPVVNKLTDIRLINTESAAVISSAKTEYYMMMGFVGLSAPLLAVLSPDSITMLTSTFVGKFLVGIVADIVVFTFFRMRKATRRVDFNSK